MKKTGIVYTKVKDQPFKGVLHIDAFRFSNDWKIGIQNLLKTADGLGMTSISTPALGTGQPVFAALFIIFGELSLSVYLLSCHYFTFLLTFG